MILVGIAGGLAAAVALVAPVVFAALHTDYFPRRPTFPVAVSIAVSGMFVAGLVDVLLGWIPAVGPLLSLLAWAYVVKHTARSEWPAALLLGAASWALSVGFFALLSIT